MNHTESIGLWRCSVPDSAGERFPASRILPSGRQALAEALRRTGMGRASRVAVPEWSSHCVLSTVARQATPVPMNEAVRCGLTVDAVLIYEQWGWPSAAGTWPEIEQRFPGAVLIWDRVDSADYLVRTDWPSRQIVADLCSLSKLLGHAGGGLLRTPAEWVEFAAEEPSAVTRELLRAKNNDGLRESFEFKEYFRNQRQMVHPDVLRWMEANSLSEAVKGELAARQDNLLLVERSRLAEGWEPWMREAVAKGAGPGIAPLMRGETRKELEAAVERLRQTHGVVTTLYHFNWSGDAVYPRYELCLPLPLHGQMGNIGDVIRELEDLQSARTGPH